MYQQHACFSFS